MDLECPYCEKGLEIDHSDGFGYEENVDHQMTCDHCSKDFVFSTAIIFHYEPRKADCLNGLKHNWNLTSTVPRVFSKMQCSMCGLERQLTDSEKVNFNIETIQEYMNSLKTTI